MVLAECEIQSATTRIWTHVEVSISNDDSYYKTGTVYINRIWHYITYNGGYALKLNQTKSYI